MFTEVRPGVYKDPDAKNTDALMRVSLNDPVEGMVAVSDGGGHRDHIPVEDAQAIVGYVAPPPAVEPESCGVVKDDGDVCGRGLPCRYHK
jgi:hypothetical protein